MSYSLSDDWIYVIHWLVKSSVFAPPFPLGRRSCILVKHRPTWVVYFLAAELLEFGSAQFPRQLFFASSGNPPPFPPQTTRPPPSPQVISETLTPKVNRTWFPNPHLADDSPGLSS